MAKLKYDRPFNIVLSSGQKATIPADEVWAVAFGVGSKLESGTTVRGGSSRSNPPATQPLPASLSNTSKSKRVHGGGAPWLRNLFLIGRFGSQKIKNRRLWYRKTSCGKWVSGAAVPMVFTCPNRILTLQALRKDFLAGAQQSKCRKSQYLLAPSLRSWRNSAVEGVTLYA